MLVFRSFSVPSINKGIFCPLLLPSSLPFVTHNRGVTWSAFPSLPHYRACLRSNHEKSHAHTFTEVSFPRAHFRRTGVHATYHAQYNARLRGAFCGHFVY